MGNEDLVKYYEVIGDFNVVFEYYFKMCFDVFMVKYVIDVGKYFVCVVI